MFSDIVSWSFVYFSFDLIFLGEKISSVVDFQTLGEVVPMIGAFKAVVLTPRLQTPYTFSMVSVEQE